MLGEIPGGNLRVYYKLEDVNDSGPNGCNLTNNNSVAFNPGKFTVGADFGNSGTNKALVYGANIFSASPISDVFISFWYKFNSTANIGIRNYFDIRSATAGTTGCQYNCIYSIASGICTLTFRRNTSAGTSDLAITFTADTNWHYVFCRRLSSGVMGVSQDRYITNFLTNSSADANTTDNATRFVNIGNSRVQSLQGFHIMDELIVSESFYNEIDNGERMKYYTQAKGRFCI